MQKINLAVLLIIIATSLTSCTHISDYAKWRLDKPISCDNAFTDIAILEEQKAGRFKTMSAGLRSILPSAVVVGILKEDYSDGVRVATGQYNADIDYKIEMIRATCNL